jgi:hypothetical protein
MYLATAVALVVLAIVCLNLLVRWSSRRGNEISGFFSDDEKDPGHETLLHLNQSRGNQL